jgi:tetratricopeptide (TPR) repeat protein
VNTGYCYAALGHMRQAIKATHQAQTLAPHRRMVTFNLVNFYLAVGAYDAAAHALGPLREHYPDDVEIALALAHIALRAGDRKRAHKILQKARTSSSWVSAPLCSERNSKATLPSCGGSTETARCSRPARSSLSSLSSATTRASRWHRFCPACCRTSATKSS